MTRAGARNRALLEWYRTHRRRLPWRDTNDPWAVLVSEVMLQQTGVSRVESVFLRFIERFPTPAKLAEAPLGEALLEWGDLGYQRRLVNLRVAAGWIDATGWPTTPEELRRLPGVGPYTAAAVACFAFGHPVPAPDVNLRRVISRWVGKELNGPGLVATAGELMEVSAASDWNQAVMDLGATVCRTRPDCGHCPVARWCADPGVSIARRSQGRYEGSTRQARAAILKALAEQGQLSIDEVAAVTGLEEPTLTEAASALSHEGVVRRAKPEVGGGGIWRLEH